MLPHKDLRQKSGLFFVCEYVVRTLLRPNVAEKRSQIEKPVAITVIFISSFCRRLS